MLNPPLYSVVLVAFVIVVGSIETVGISLQEIKLAQSTAKDGAPSILSDMLRKRSATNLPVLLGLSLYEILVGQTTYIVVLCALLAAAYPMTAMVRIRFAGKMQIEQDKPTIMTGLTVLLLLASGLLQSAVIVGLVFGISRLFV